SIVLDYYVEVACQFDYDRRSLRLFEVDTDTALAAIVVDIAWRLAFDPGWIAAQPGVFASRRHLELDDFCAQIREHPSEGGTGDILRNVQNANAGKILGHSLSHLNLRCAGVSRQRDAQHRCFLYLALRCKQPAVTDLISLVAP